MHNPKAITLHDATPSGTPAFDLIDLLRIVEDEVRSSTWYCCDVESVGPAAEELDGYSGSESSLTGWDLMRIAQRIERMIDGDFWGYRRDGDPIAFLVIRAVKRDRCFAVICEDEAILERFRRRFHDVRDAPGHAAFVR
jgi:PAS domain-containing protein